MRFTISTRRRRRMRLGVGTVVILGLAVVVDAAKSQAGGTGGRAMTRERKLELRDEAKAMFHHGYNSYMTYAFPSDEIRPLTCSPNNRDTADPLHIHINDVLGSFSLTALDTLSTLAILAHDSPFYRAEFWAQVDRLRTVFGEKGGFDLDSTVQVFETTIRALGGLLSAHLFATGEFQGVAGPESQHYYDGVLLQLAYDLGIRLLPAFETSPTGLPHARVNLRYGLRKKTKFRYDYLTSDTVETARIKPFGYDRRRKERLYEPVVNPAEDITETCAAGAGSLVLEMTVLSRLTGDGRFEEVAKRAFDAVWERRGATGLVAGGVDSETGDWKDGISGIGAGIDSFYEYAFKSYILHAGDEGVESEGFREVFEESRGGINKYLRMDIPFTHYINAALTTGAPVTNWVDSLGAYYPGLLVSAGYVEDATRVAMLYTSLWTRYRALPERWNYVASVIEGGLGWWPGRPELVESLYMLYRATRDPYYLYVGEQIMTDIKERCWAECGWAGLQDVASGEKQDRMESFWLSETWKYLVLLFDEENPLHYGDNPWVFSTEGHPLIIPKAYTYRSSTISSSPALTTPPPTCPSPAPIGLLPPQILRPDLYHPLSLTKLHLLNHHVPFLSPTIPRSLFPSTATSAPLPQHSIFELVFPDLGGTISTSQIPAKRLENGLVLLTALSNVRIGMVKLGQGKNLRYRAISIGGVSLKDGEKVMVRRELVKELNDPTVGVKWRGGYFFLEFLPPPGTARAKEVQEKEVLEEEEELPWAERALRSVVEGNGSVLDLLFGVDKAEEVPVVEVKKVKMTKGLLSPGSAQLEDGTMLSGLAWADGYGCTLPSSSSASDSWSSDFSSSSDSEEEMEMDPFESPYRDVEVLAIPRGGCTFLQKLQSIPDTLYPNLKLVLFVDNDARHDGELIRPLVNDAVFEARWGVALVGGAGLVSSLGEVSPEGGEVRVRVKRGGGVVVVGGVEVGNWEVL
ncbi:seven-hairpin glycosidase [Ascobolus immersus RN42]|uniref:alpha-1,2-Mannosidase n=1 Tax=Ascobolus immersus RN42 TaxID=1160509 RepID=A0A3N4HNF6_ASCIM|nr:seven-hairpin glycosidase [Ascobolus immersus RN42]